MDAIVDEYAYVQVTKRIPYPLCAIKGNLILVPADPKRWSFIVYALIGHRPIPFRMQLHPVLSDPYRLVVPVDLQLPRGFSREAWEPANGIDVFLRLTRKGWVRERHVHPGMIKPAAASAWFSLALPFSELDLERMIL